MPVASKVLTLDALASKIASFHDSGQKVAHCHGVFDLLHIGHIRHLQGPVRWRQADRHHHPGSICQQRTSPAAFSEALRADAVAALDCVDAVAINEWPTAVETIGTLKPDLYIKGGEYRESDKDVSGGIVREREAIESVGGQLCFTDEVTFSSSYLLNQYLPVLSDKARSFLAEFSKRTTVDSVLDYVDRIRDLRILVIGETIIDEYRYCQSIGKSSKAAALVAKLESEERFAGGILAVANHVAAFCDNVSLVSQWGSRDRHADFIQENLNDKIETHFLERQNSPTILKRRYIESYFFTPMFELYDINDESLSEENDRALCSLLEEELPKHDLVIVVDYGHGMLSKNAVDVIAARSKFLAMNAQANAGNRGYHRISKYPRADYVCAAEHEMMLETPDWRGDLHPVLLDVSERLSCPRVLVTCGKRGSICYSKNEGFVEVPALATKVVDRVGAGDAFLSVTAPLAAMGAPMDLLALVGNVAGAQAVATVGNRDSLERVSFSKHLKALLPSTG